MRIFCFLTALLVFCTESVHAQENENIPNDSQIITGKLENGLTYYIRNNELEQGCADFYILHNVGALQEEDHQNGLAHFLEHMAFNGTKHYPDKSLLDFLAEEGVRFGYNVNAYTSRTETVYNISKVPLVRETFVDSVLLVLHDWSCDISCEQEALDAERGVISEEWRRRDDPRSIMAMKQTNLIYKGAKHTERNVLGTLEVINGFKRQDIIDFYHKWYRPDLQAIVVVGDFDPEKMEKKIREKFSDIPAHENPAAKEKYTPTPLSEPLFENMVDKSTKYITLKVIHKNPYPERSERMSYDFQKDRILNNVATEVVKDRFSRFAKKDESPAKSAVLVTSKSMDDFYTSMFTISPKSDKLLEETLEAYERELNRILKFGIIPEEVKAAKFRAAKRLRLDSQTPVTNDQFVNLCKENFLRGESMAHPQELREIQKIILAEITFEEVFEKIRSMFTDSEKIYSYSIGEDKKDLLPSAERMKEIIAEVAKEDLKPDFPVFEEIDFSVNAPAGKIVSVTKGNRENEEIWTLGNGINVHFIPSEEVKSSTHLTIMTCLDTGFGAFPQDKLGTARAASSFFNKYAGMRGYSARVLREAPECGDVFLTTGTTRSESEMKITCGKNDVETAFRMFHLQLAEPYFDTQKSLDRFKKDNVDAIARRDSSRNAYNLDYMSKRYSDHPWWQDITADDIKAVDMEMVKDVFERCFLDLESMNVYISTDQDKETIRGYVEKYIASLQKPAGEIEKVKMDPTPSYVSKVECIHTTPVKTVPKSEVQCCFKNEFKLTPKQLIVFEVFDYIMGRRYSDQIREARGGTYHVSFFTEINHRYKTAESSVAFQTRPELTDVLISDVYDIIDDMSKTGPTAEEMDMALKYFHKRHKEKEAKDKDNLSKKLDDYMMEYKYGLRRDADYEKMLDEVRAKDLKKAAKKLMKGDNMLSVYTENNN